MKLTKFVQSTILLEHEDSRLLADPGNYNFQSDRLERDFFREIDILVVTHGHADHFDLEAVKLIWKQSKPVIFTVQEVTNILLESNIPSRVLRVGDSVFEGGFALTGVHADHIVRGQRVDAVGFVASDGHSSLYHASDTNYLEEKPYADLVLVPINNRGVSMGIEDAARFVREINPKVAIPIHYDSPKDAHINPREFADALRNSEISVKILGFGKSFDL